MFADLPCYYKPVIMPSGKWACFPPVQKQYYEANEHCKSIGYDRLVEPRTKEDNIFISKFTACRS